MGTTELRRVLPPPGGPPRAFAIRSNGLLRVLPDERIRVAWHSPVASANVIFIREPVKYGIRCEISELALKAIECQFGMSTLDELALISISQ